MLACKDRVHYWSCRRITRSITAYLPDCCHLKARFHVDHHGSQPCPDRHCHFFSSTAKDGSLTQSRPGSLSPAVAIGCGVSFMPLTPYHTVFTASNHLTGGGLQARAKRPRLFHANSLGHEGVEIIISRCHLVCLGHDPSPPSTDTAVAPVQLPDLYLLRIFREASQWRASCSRSCATCTVTTVAPESGFAALLSMTRQLIGSYHPSRAALRRYRFNDNAVQAVTAIVHRAASIGFSTIHPLVMPGPP